jgi:glycine oxidase
VSCDAVVAGGGVVGSAIAHALAREGLSVCLLERGRLATQASGAAAGMLSPGGEADGPGPGLRLALQSLRAFPELCAELRERSGIDPELEVSGTLRVAFSTGEAAALRARAAALRECRLEWLDERATRDAEPRLAPGAAGAVLAPEEGHVRSALLAQAYAGAAAALGARVETGVAVQGLLLEGSRAVGVRTAAGDFHAGWVVVATGAFSGDLGAWLHGAWAPPVEPIRGQILSLDGPRPPLRQVRWGEDCYLVPRRDGSVVVGATMERVGFDCRVTAAGLRGLLDAAPRLVPALADAGFRAGWAGLRPGSPDGQPGVGPVPGFERLLVAVGHHRSGVLLSPVTARIAADLVAGKELSPEARALDPARWSS